MIKGLDWKSIKEHPQNAEAFAQMKDRPEYLLWHPRYGFAIGTVWHWADGECVGRAPGFHNVSFPFFAEINGPDEATIAKGEEVK